MGATLGYTQYGKGETRVVRVFRAEGDHELVDYTVSVALGGDFDAVYTAGDNANCLTTDAMKNTVYALAGSHPDEARQPETFGHALASHFVDEVPQVGAARITIDAHPWVRLHPHAFRREGGLVRTATVTYGAGRAWTVSGVRDLFLLKTTDSEFADFYTDAYTTLAPTHDRVLATLVTARWWHTFEPDDWDSSFDRAVAVLSSTFAGHHSPSLQQTLYEMGSAVIADQPGIGEIRLALPNQHHFVVDLTPFGLANDNEVFHASDRPYGLIEGSVRRHDRPDPGLAFEQAGSLGMMMEP